MSGSIWRPRFWIDAAERAIKTTAQTAAGLISANGLGLTDVNWKGVAGVAGLAFVYSVLTSIGSAPIGGSGSASVLKGE